MNRIIVMKRLIFLLSITLVLGIGTVTARAGGGHGGHGGGGGHWGGGHGHWGGGHWGGHGWYGGGCWPWFGFGIGLGGYYPAYGYGYGYPAYYPAYGYPAYGYPAYYGYPYARAVYSQPAYVYRTAQPNVGVTVSVSQSQTARPIAAAAVAHAEPTVSAVSANTASARINPQPAEAQLPNGAQNVLKLSRAKVGNDVIQRFVRNSGTTYNLTAADIVYLHGEGVSDEVLRSMLARQTQAVGVPVSNPKLTSTSVAAN